MSKGNQIYSSLALTMICVTIFMALIESPKTTVVEQIKVPGKLSEGHTICDLTKKKK